MIREPNICDSCAHLDRTSIGGTLPFAPRCNAFPDGIPVMIWFEGVDHREPIGDEPTTYDMQPGKDDNLQAYLDRRDHEDANQSLQG